MQRTLIVQASCNGVYGYGEATENDFYGATAHGMATLVDGVQPLLADLSPEDIETAVARVSDHLLAVSGDEAPKTNDLAAFTLCAIDAALHDLWGKTVGQPVGNQARHSLGGGQRHRRQYCANTV